MAFAPVGVWRKAERIALPFTPIKKRFSRLRLAWELDNQLAGILPFTVSVWPDVYGENLQSTQIVNLLNELNGRWVCFVPPNRAFVIGTAIFEPAESFLLFRIRQEPRDQSAMFTAPVIQVLRTWYIFGTHTRREVVVVFSIFIHHTPLA